MPVEPDDSRTKLLLRLFWVIVACETVFASVHAYVHLTWWDSSGLSATMFSLSDVRWGFGPSTWLTVVTMFLVGWTALGHTRSRPPSECNGWKLVGWLCLCLAVGHAFTTHESVGRWTHQYGIAWVSVLLLAVLVLLGFLFFWRILRPYPHCLVYMVAAFGCLGLSVLLGVFEKNEIGTGDRYRGILLVEYTSLVEEFLESLSPALLLRSLALLRRAGDGKAGRLWIQPNA